MFGSQAIRLIREAWGGVLRPDAEGAMREKGAKQLAEELYAMFDDDIPLEHDGPVTINKGSNAAPLTINNNFGGNDLDGTPFERPPGGDSLVINGGDFVHTGGDFTVEGVTVTLNGTDTTVGGDTVTIAGSPIHVTTDGSTRTLEEYILSLVDGGGGGGIVGVVASGSGQAYQVDLHADGFGEDETSTVSATAPDVADGETLDAGTHVAVFRAGSAYYIFPPVWL